MVASKPCCSPSRNAARDGPPGRAVGEPGVPIPTQVEAPCGAAVSGPPGGLSGLQDIADMVEIPAGVFAMGCSRHEGHASDGEGPSRPVRLEAFRLDRLAVTNARFERFAAATGYRTDAERQGWSFVFAGLLPDAFAETRGVAAAPWWREVHGADWRHPDGPHSSLAGRSDHPVVHVSHDDALAFCAWAGKRLPTEAEWERAARGGLEGRRFPWGDDETPGGRHPCNVWQGVFPSDNHRLDGHYGLAPADSFEPNGYGLHNMAGNCWEWCADWFDARWPAATARRAAPGPVQDPRGPAGGLERVMRGGSYLCHPSYCWRYRNAARSAASPDSSTGHIGFRCASS